MVLSHILYKVDNLHEAVEFFRNSGFTIIYGSHPDKAFNALIWFNKGPFVELFQISSNRFSPGMMKIIRKKGTAVRFENFQKSGYGWVDYALENNRSDLLSENQLLDEMGYQYSTMHGMRTDINGTKLEWKLSMPSDLNLPFLMSSYSVDPRPVDIRHKNGAKEVSRLVWGTSRKCILDINKLNSDRRLELIEGNGFQHIEINGCDSDLFNKTYFRQIPA